MTSTYKLKQYLKQHLSQKRYKHILRVAKIARELALIYEVDVDKAIYASLGHDIAKEMKDEEAKAFIKKYHIELDPSIVACPNLAHGEIGAILLKEKFDCKDEEILEAVRWHTYGNENMSVLSKIVYMADVVEDSRHFDGVEELRKLVRADLDKAILTFYNQSINYMAKNDQKIHGNTLKMINKIKERLE